MQDCLKLSAQQLFSNFGNISLSGLGYDAVCYKASQSQWFSLVSCSSYSYFLYVPIMFFSDILCIFLLTLPEFDGKCLEVKAE